MDNQTIAHYKKSADYFIDHYQGLTPLRVYELVSTFFHRGARTLDLGCASGRDLAYLIGAGFKMEGLDIIPDFVRHCRHQFSNVPIHEDSLPLLEKLKDDAFDNILISAVLMHLDGDELNEAVANILRICKSEARIIVTIRSARPEKAEGERETDGRLYHSIPMGKLVSIFEGLGARLMFSEAQAKHGRAETNWLNFVFEKIGPENRPGIDILKDIIRENAQATPLIKTLAEVAADNPGEVTYAQIEPVVHVPLYLLEAHAGYLEEQDLFPVEGSTMVVPVSIWNDLIKFNFWIKETLDR